MSENKKRAMSSEKAQKVKKKGHSDEKEFAEVIGMKDEYKNGATDKKDVVDQNGDTHSLKGGDKRWQIFLYGIKRFQTDQIYKVMGGVGDGIGTLIHDCLDCFPEKFDDYELDKEKYKQLLKSKMIALGGKLQNNNIFSAFLLKSMFNCGEVIYLTIKNDDKFHVFYNNDVIDILTKNLLRETSKAIAEGQMDYQKVTMVYKEKNVGTIEIRHDSKEHYRQAVFSLDKTPIFELLSSSTTKEDWGDKVCVYGKAIKKFAKKHKKYLTE